MFSKAVMIAKTTKMSWFIDQPKNTITLDLAVSSLISGNREKVCIVKVSKRENAAVNHRYKKKRAFRIKVYPWFIMCGLLINDRKRFICN